MTADIHGHPYLHRRGAQEHDDLITASMGPAYDRTRERLVGTDAAVIATRRAVLDMAADHAAGRPLIGRSGRGFDMPSVFIETRPGQDWRQGARAAMAAKRVRPQVRTAVAAP